MHIIRTYPLAKGVRAQELNYYYAKPINRGTLIEVPFGNREIPAVVAGCTNAENQKAQIRSADYELKPVKLEKNQIFFSQFLSACENFSAYSGVTTGATVNALTPTQIVDNSDQIPDVSSDFLQPDITAPPGSIIQATANKQIEYISSLVHNRVQAGRSVFICTPTISGCHRVANQIQSEKTIQLHSGKKKSEILSNWRQALQTKQAVVIVGTPTFLCLPICDLGQIIITEESDDAYKMTARPFLDKSKFARHLANTYKQPHTLTDRVLSTETLWEYENKDLTDQHKPTFSYHKDIDTELIDMTELPETNDSGVRVFSPNLAKALRKIVTGGQQAILYVARSGRRPFTVCRDCGEAVSCPQCGLPLSLTTDANDERQFVCRTCNQEHSSNRRCNNCDSWHLQPLGIGINFVTEILKKQLDSASVYQVDKNNTETDKAVAETLDSFFADNGSILTTTSLGINHLTQPVAFSGVVTADSLMAIPDLSVSHDLFSLLIALREHTQEQMIVQTRSRQTDLFTHALAGDVNSFYTNQIEQRKQFDYPPFSYLIKLHINESKGRSKKLLKRVKENLSDYQLQIYPNRQSNGINILIRASRENWVDKELVSLLRSLPLAVSINAHPRSLL